MKVVYIDGHSPDEELAKACASIGMFRYADMADFKIADPRLMGEVFTDNKDIAEACGEVGIKVNRLPSLSKAKVSITNQNKPPRSRGKPNQTLDGDKQ